MLLCDDLETSTPHVPRWTGITRLELCYVLIDMNNPMKKMQRLTSPEPSSQGSFGIGMQFHGNHLVVAAPYETVAPLRLCPFLLHACHSIPVSLLC